MPDILTVTLNPALDVSTSVARLLPTHKLRCASERRDPGGGGINVARVIQRLGGDVAALFPSGGPIGSYLERLLSDEGVISSTVAIAGVTRESFTIVETDTAQEYRFVLPGPALAPMEFAALIEMIQAQAQPRYVVASGSLSAGLPEDAYGRLAVAARARGGKFVLDASGPALAAALEAGGIHLIKPNWNELEDLAGAPLNSDRAALAFARRLIARGQVDIVAVSKGAEGALLVTADEAWTAEAIASPVQSSVGAGDSFLGGLVWALAGGAGPEAALCQALAAGAAALLRPGTALCRADDVARLAPMARPKRIS